MFRDLVLERLMGIDFGLTGQNSMLDILMPDYL